ncbi:peptidoglycan DD-metalloendopeptidase family protein [Desulfovibrio subterraneus]|uniref:Peptidase M24 n=1 Tax=Desulfovibrio subterraneus TaxID=2718620 RepID=A0A7J0BM94_9BACT|nr:peptidoglycan DD-metalloendopeptidase family protein [Desulfovibrio subterraneus]GFM34800.1 peptidase M24 [Desulfovibrio subterraneus]
MNKNYRFSSSGPKRKKYLVIAGVCAAALTLSALFGIFGTTSDTSTPVAAVEQEKTVEQPAPAVPQGPVKAVHPGIVGNGDTASSILAQWFNPAEIHELAQICKPVFPLRQLRAGQPYRVYTEDGVVTRLEYEIDNDKFLTITPQKKQEGVEACPSFTAELHDIPYDYKTVRVAGTVSSSLFEAVEQAGENASLAIVLADIFGWEIDFIRNLREGDKFSAVVEKRYRDGEFKGYKRVLAASFTNQGELHEGFRMKDEYGVYQFFNAEGGNLRRAFLKAPLSFQRISSNFSRSRLHPVLKTYRPHYGVDYAAPTGTPVHAIGDGTVTKVARDHAAGNYIKIRHVNGYESGYLHLSRFAKGMKSGKRIRQGETIGYVGSTGYATGPHLDFRIQKNGSYLNPRQIISPRSEPVSKKQMGKFKTLVQELRPMLNPETTVGTITVPNESN